jgi:hypothetical protein
MSTWAYVYTDKASCLKGARVCRSSAPVAERVRDVSVLVIPALRPVWQRIVSNVKAHRAVSTDRYAAMQLTTGTVLLSGE